MENQTKPSSSKFTFILGFFAGLAVISMISFFILLGLLFANREPVNLGAQAEVTDPAATEQTPTSTIPKSDKPTVDLFVMSHCPYGTQMEKGIIPVFNALGDKIDAKIRFVYYAMHGEKEVNEELNQYCIQKEQKTKFLAYLTCFLGEGNGADCLSKVKIDTAKLNACVKAADKEFSVTKNLQDENSWLSGSYPLFNIDKALNEKYSVGGSPTLIINGQEVQASRDSASLLATICAAFNTLPAECSTQLSSEQPSAGFGYSTTSGSNSQAQCE